MRASPPLLMIGLSIPVDSITTRARHNPALEERTDLPTAQPRGRVSAAMASARRSSLRRPPIWIRSQLAQLVTEAPLVAKHRATEVRLRQRSRAAEPPHRHAQFSGF